MRTLSASLLAAQRGSSGTPYVGVNMVKAGQTTYTYTTTDATNRIWSIEHVESIWGSTARTIIRLQNADQYFSDHDFRGYKVYAWFGYSGEYSECAPQWVYDQREISEEGILLTELYCVDIWWRLGRLKVVGGGVKLSGTITGTFQLAESITEKTDPGNVPTGVTALKLLTISSDHIVVTGAVGVFTAGNKAVGDVSAAEIAMSDVSVGGAGAAPGWEGDTTILNIVSSLLVDVADAIDDTGGGDAQLATMPTYLCDRFDPILGVLRRMMEQTYSGLLFQADDDVHLIYLDPAEAVEYNYDSLHAFFVDVRSRRLVIPNKVFVLDRLPDNESAQYTYWGVADDTVSQAAIGIVTALFEDPAITTNEEAATKAAALLSRMQDETTQGTVIAPMNCGQELFDKISIADARANLTLVGRVGIIRRVYNPPSANRLEHYSIECRIGGLTDIVDISSPQSMIESLLTYGYGRLSVPGGAVSGPLFSPSVTIDASQVNFAPATLSKWTGSADPGQTDDALDQLADRTKTLEGTTHAAVTLGAGAAELTLAGQQLTLAEVLTPTEHTAIGDASPHHAAVTLATDADTLLGLSTQQLTLDTQTANLVLAGPISGAAADPTFRSLVSADLPATVVETGDADWIDLTDGGATTLHSHAGTGTHNLLSASHPDTVAASPVLGDVLYGDATPNWTKLAGQITTTRKFLRQLGTGAVSAVPAWDTIADADVPATHSGSAHHSAVTLGADAEVLLGLSTQQLTLDTQTANYIFAGPESGVAADPTFRAMVAADLVSHGAAQHTDRTLTIPLDLGAGWKSAGTGVFSESYGLRHSFPDAETGALQFAFCVPARLVAGTVTVIWAWETPAAAGNAYIRIALGEMGNGDASAWNLLNSANAFEIDTVGANTNKVDSIASGVAASTGDKYFVVVFQREAGNALDTINNTLYLRNIWLKFTGDM